jgi:hypothetical protein
MAYRVSKNAERGLDEIFLYWATGTDLEVADRLIDRITGRWEEERIFSTSSVVRVTRGAPSRKPARPPDPVHKP